MTSIRDLFPGTPGYLFSHLSRDEVRGLLDLARRGLIAMCETPQGWRVWIVAEVPA